MMAVDMDGAFYACRAVLPGMIHEVRPHPAGQQYVGPDRRQLRGRVQRGQGGPHRSGQGAGKEEGPSGITVNVIAPGVIDTDMMAGFTAEDRAALAEETRWSAWAQRTRLHARWSFWPMEASGYITGQVLGVNGGLVI